MGTSLELICKEYNFLNRTPVAQTLRSRINKWHLVKLKTSVRQRAQSLRQRYPTDWAKIFTNPTFHRELTSKIHKEFENLDTNNPNNSIKKWATKLNREPTTEKSLMVEHPKEMFNIFHHHRNANQNNFNNNSYYSKYLLCVSMFQVLRPYLIHVSTQQ